MIECPRELGGLEVVCWTQVDARHRPTGFTRHVVAGKVIGPAECLAICRAEQGTACYLFYCTADWQIVTDTWHETLETAKRQAEAEYQGTSGTWRKGS